MASAHATGTAPASYNWTYTYDRYGNLQCSGTGGGSSTCSQMTYNSSTNQLSAIGSQSVTYDAAGNLLSDGSGAGSHSYTWDAEGRMTSVGSPAGTTVATYTYNALGQRVERSGSGVPNGGTLDEYHDAFGNLAEVFSSAVAIEYYVPSVGGQRRYRCARLA